MIRTCIGISLVCILFTACTEEGDTYITNVTSPEDWQPPQIEWRTQPDPELRGTVGVDFAITDSSEVTAIRAYLDGVATDSAFTSPYRFSLITDSLLDGVHIVEIRATDEYGNLGISPILRINVSNSVAQGPRLIWVPDEFARIQDAINAATDFDTIRVRSGTYYETLNTFGKGIWLESEHGPLSCSINADGASNSIYCPASDQFVCVRGFHMTGGTYLVYLGDGSRVNFYNNYLALDSVRWLMVTSYSNGDIANNLFSGSRTAIQLSYHWGSFFNNILQLASNVALWNAALARNPVEYGHNLFWQNHQNYQSFEPGIGDLDSDPFLDLIDGRLMDGSPAFDAGDPRVLDRDSSISDIGPFGGPWAYY
ncbi:MAG: hypothetical protein IPG71_01580 [bacterium]|nr:hypothetical protein [bacterium]